MKVTVTFDARMWAHAGIGRYVSELSKALIARRNSGFHFRFLGPEPFDKTVLKEAREPGVSFCRTISGIYGAAEQLEVLFRSLRGDVLHVPHFNAPVLFPKKMVVTVHDLIYLEPGALRSTLGRAYVRMMLKVIQKRNNTVIVVSEATKRSLLDRCPGLTADRVFVIREAASARLRRVGDPDVLGRVRKKFALNEPFVLFVGTLKPHKNLGALIEALHRVREDHGLPHELVIVGRSDPNHPEIYGLIHAASQTRFVGEVTDEELAALYTMADVFVLPSFHEGFGLPALEAMACGTPVIVSDRASLPEVVGDAGQTFDPDRVDALSELLYTVLKNRDLREEMSFKGLERAKEFSWEQAAEETLRVYQKVLRI